MNIKNIRGFNHRGAAIFEVAMILVLIGAVGIVSVKLVGGGISTQVEDIGYALAGMEYYHKDVVVEPSYLMGGAAQRPARRIQMMLDENGNPMDPWVARFSELESTGRVSWSNGRGDYTAEMMDGKWAVTTRNIEIVGSRPAGCGADGRCWGAGTINQATTYTYYFKTPKAIKAAEEKMQL